MVVLAYSFFRVKLSILFGIPWVIFQNCPKYQGAQGSEWYFGQFWNITSQYYGKIPHTGHAIICLLEEIYLLCTEDLYSSQLKKQTQASAFLTIFLHQWKRKKGPIVFCKTITSTIVYHHLTAIKVVDYHYELKTHENLVK